MSPPSTGASLIFILLAPLTLFQRCGAAGNTTYDPQYKFCAASAGSLSGVYQVNLNQFVAELPSDAMKISRFFDGTL